VLAGLGAVAVIAASGFPAHTRAADHEFRAEYRITLNGLPIGRAMLQGSFESAHYRLDGFAKLTGIAGMLFDYSSTAAAAGRVRAGRLYPSAFSADSSDGRRAMSVRMTLVNNAVRRLRLDPPVPPHQERHPKHVRITEAHRQGVIDPVTAMVGFGGFDGETFDSGLCKRSLPIFNGRERFDIELDYDGIRTVDSGGPDGYSGPALVCTARTPDCARCPITAQCAWQQAGAPEHQGPARRGQTYAGTDRQVRGKLLAVLRESRTAVDRATLDRVWNKAEQRNRALRGLVADGLVERLPDGRYRLPGG
jgi:hypothetical protein